MVRAKGKAFLENLFDHADPLETFLFKHLAEGLDLESMDGRARFSKLAAPHLHRLPEGVFKTLMYQALAEKTGIDVDSLKRLQPPPAPRPEPNAVEPSSAQDGPPPTDPDEPPPEDVMPVEEPVLESLSPSSLNPIHRLLGLLVLKPALVGHVPDALLVTEGSRDAVLLSEVVAHIRKYPEVTTAALLGFWFGTPEGDFLNALAGRETVEEDAGLEASVHRVGGKAQPPPRTGCRAAAVRSTQTQSPTGSSPLREKQQLTHPDAGNPGAVWQGLASQHNTPHGRATTARSARVMGTAPSRLRFATSTYSTQRELEWIKSPVTAGFHSKNWREPPLAEDGIFPPIRLVLRGLSRYTRRLFFARPTQAPHDRPSASAIPT